MIDLMKDYSKLAKNTPKTKAQLPALNDAQYNYYLEIFNQMKFCRDNQSSENYNYYHENCDNTLIPNPKPPKPNPNPLMSKFDIRSPTHDFLDPIGRSDAENNIFDEHCLGDL
jgi:hypothetical protein